METREYFSGISVLRVSHCLFIASIVASFHPGSGVDLSKTGLPISSPKKISVVGRHGEGQYLFHKTKPKRYFKSIRYTKSIHYQYRQVNLFKASLAVYW